MKKPVLAVFVAFFTLSMSFTFAANVTEDFQNNPLQNGWQIFGETNLFHWDSTNGNLAITWDSSRPNSYFYHPLDTVLTRNDDFSISFDLRMDDFLAGSDQQMPGPFPLAIGLINQAEARDGGFLRGTGYSTPDLVEFGFFPDPGGDWTYGPSLTDIMVDQTGFNWAYGSEVNGMTANDLYRITLNHAAGSDLVMTITRNGSPFGTATTTSVNTNFTDFHVDAISINSYSQDGQDTNSYGGVIYAGSILAHGTVDNVVVTLPKPAVQDLKGLFENGIWETQFTGRTNFVYTLERSADFRSWAEISAPVAGLNGRMTLRDTNVMSNQFYYRVRANLP